MSRLYETIKILASSLMSLGAVHLVRIDFCILISMKEKKRTCTSGLSITTLLPKCNHMFQLSNAI
jgi:hypothetical protein